tara:strand:- start:952 stop:1137 length:186 start_codon:yes stop_codon:yes gene_type:complete
MSTVYLSIPQYLMIPFMVTTHDTAIAKVIAIRNITATPSVRIVAVDSLANSQKKNLYIIVV